MNWLRRNWLLVVILITALVLRLYHIDTNMTFLEDEGRDLLIAKRMIETAKPVLLGPQTSTGNMYLGPLYYYLITPALWLSQMNPVGPAILIAISGVLTAWGLFYLGNKWFSKRAGYLAAILFATLPFSVSVTRGSWNPHLVPLISTLMLIIYDRLTEKTSAKNWFFYGLLVGTMVQLHYMALVFCGAVSLSLAWQYRSKLHELLKGVALSLVGVLIMLAPFILFEYRNNWVNTRALTSFLAPAEGKNIRYDVPAWLWWHKVSSTSYRLIGNTLVGSEMGNTRFATITVTLYLALLILGVIAAKKYSNPRLNQLIIILLIALLTLGIYQENIHLHYLEFGIPLIILTFVGLWNPKNPQGLQWLTGVLTVFILATALPRTLGYISSDGTHQAEKARDVAQYIVDHAGSGSYNVVSTQGLYTTPFQYFLANSSHPPSNELAPKVFVICDGKPCAIDEETTTLLFLTGPAHPSIAMYLGHPQLNSFGGKRRMVSNEHVSYGLWVAELEIVDEHTSNSDKINP